MSSFKTDRRDPFAPSRCPTNWQLDNYAQGLETRASATTSSNTVIVVVLCADPGRCCSARWAPTSWPGYEFPGNRLIYYFFVGRADVPGLPGAGAAVLHGARTSGMLNTLPGLILVYVAYSLPFTVFFLHAFFRTLPTAIVRGGGARRGLAHPDVLPGDAADGQARADQRWRSSTSWASGTSSCCRWCSTPTSDMWVLTQGLVQLASAAGLRHRLRRPVRRCDDRDGPGAGRRTASSSARSQAGLTAATFK